MSNFKVTIFSLTQLWEQFLLYHICFVLLQLTLTPRQLCDCCLLVTQHPSDMQVYLSDGFALTIVRAATLRYKLQIKLSTSRNHNRLTSGQPVPSTDPITLGAWQDSHWSANFSVTGVKRNLIPSFIIIIIRGTPMKMLWSKCWLGCPKKAASQDLSFILTWSVIFSLTERHKSKTTNPKIDLANEKLWFGHTSIQTVLKA